MYSFLHHPNLSKTEKCCNLSYTINLTFMLYVKPMLYKLSLVNILENVFVFIEILFKMLLFKGGVLIYAEHCIYIHRIMFAIGWDMNSCNISQ